MTLKQLVREIEKSNELAEKYNFAQRHEARVYEDGEDFNEYVIGHHATVKGLRKAVKKMYVPEARKPVLECELKPYSETHGTIWEGECTIVLDERVAPIVEDRTVKKTIRVFIGIC